MPLFATLASSVTFSAEHRLTHFGLEAIPGSQAQHGKMEGDTFTPETKVERTERIDKSYPTDHAVKLKQQYEEHDKATVKDQADTEQMLDTKLNQMDITERIGKAMKGLEGTDPKFQERFENALVLAGMKNVTVVVKARHRGGGITVLKGKPNGQPIVTFLATNNGTAEKLEWPVQSK